MLRKPLPASLAAVLALALAAGSTTAQAQTRKVPQPLAQYVVSGKVDTDALARAGFDLREASVTGQKGKFFVVATPRQVAALARKGVTIRRLTGGRARSRARTAAAPEATALPAPTHGYDVFRPWSLKPAPCPTTCATPLKPLKAFYRDLARANPDVVKEEIIGRSVRGQPIFAFKVTANARRTPDGARPAVLYDGVQHAREWIAAETERRLFRYVVANKNQRDGQGIRRLLRQRELWFVPVVNPDGYDYTFTSPGTRLWRKNLRDNDGDGQITDQDGVDTNRNWPTKWNYDLEGASADRTAEDYHGTAPASEPEVRALRGLERRIRPRFQIDYHSFAQLILYPEGWQVETPTTDAPLLAALAGDDDRPAVPGFDPDVAAELYTTNGDVTDDALKAFGIEPYTVELSGGSGDPVGGTDGSDPDAYTPGGFVFQDREADVRAEFQKNLAFALDLARSAKRPDRPISHLGNTALDLVPTQFGVSYGSPQTVEVNAKRALGNVRARWQVNDGAVRGAPTSEWAGGTRYGDPGVYYHRLRAQVTGTKPGDKVRVWFTARGRQSASFTFRVAKQSNNRVLLVVAEDYSGRSGDPSDTSDTPYPGPRYRSSYAKALRDAGIGFDVYNVDARGRTAPSSLGVLSHYRGVVWETGDDLYVRGPGQVRPGGPEGGGTTGTEKLFDDEILATRDFMNEGGKLLVGGKFALQGAWDQLLYNPLGATPPNPLCNSSGTLGGGNEDDPPGQTFNCVAVANDFQQYWLGAYLPITAAADNDEAAALPFRETDGLGSLAFRLNGADSAANQDNVYSFLTTSSILKPSTYPQFRSQQLVGLDRPPSFDPPTGSWYVNSQSTDSTYRRLARTVDVPAGGGSLAFKLSYDTEPDFDYVFVEAHTVGQDDWTTLPDLNGNTSQDTGAGCPDDDPFWLTDNPFLRHYITRTGTTGAFECSPTGTSGQWNAATGNSGGFQTWRVDLGRFAGKKVEVSITYMTDPGTTGLGAFVDDATVTAGAASATTSFEDGLGGWTVPGAPADSGPNSTDWIRSRAVGYVDGPGVGTDHSVYLGFGPEGVTGAANRARLLGDALRYLGVGGG